MLCNNKFWSIIFTETILRIHTLWRIQDFPDWRKPNILAIFSENCMKLREHWIDGFQIGVWSTLIRLIRDVFMK